MYNVHSLIPDDNPTKIVGLTTKHQAIMDQSEAGDSVIKVRCTGSYAKFFRDHNCYPFTSLRKPKYMSKMKQQVETSI